jgi:2,3-dihydroxy-p-cumate/2,3-dihydroxybenzoate 3,4-dioxygenase
MIKHMVLFALRENVQPKAVDELILSMADFPRRYPAMRRFAIGRNVSTRDSTYAYAMTMEFDSQQELAEYLGSEFHEDFVATRFKPLIQSRAIASIAAAS